MKLKNFTAIFAFFLLTNLTVFGQTTDTLKKTIHSVQTDTLTAITKTDQFVGTDDLSPMQLFFVLILLGVILLGIGLTILILFIVFGLVSAGILSTSIIVGLNKKSFTKGFKTFILIVSTITGLLVGCFSFVVIHKINHWWTIKESIISGAISGLLGGFVFGLLLFYILRRLTTYFRQKLKLIF
jgi:hypothetical protein